MSPRIVADFCCFWVGKVFKLSKLMLLLARPSFSTRELRGSFITFVLAICAMLFDRSRTLSRSRCCNNSKLKWHFSKYLATSSMMHRYICRLFSTFQIEKKENIARLFSSTSVIILYLSQLPLKCLDLCLKNYILNAIAAFILQRAVRQGSHFRWVFCLQSPVFFNQVLAFLKLIKQDFYLIIRQNFWYL